ncbi:MAG TPA: porin, partial [Planktothrix sp. UBA8407]|nr:porin [Planktothrix sp. UBA8407]
MAQKNDTTILILALLITGGLISGGIWWFTRNMNLPTVLNSNPSPSSSIPPKPSPIPPTSVPQTST